MTSYVLFGRSATGSGARNLWIGSGGTNSHPGVTPGNGAQASSFNADVATAAGTVLAGPAAADYAADGILSNGNVAMFDLTETPTGVFATAAPADLETRIASSAPLFGAANSALDPAHSDIDLSVGKLHLAQTDHDWNGIKNLEISLDSATSFRDIRLENFVDTRLRIGDLDPDPGNPQGAVFDVQLLGTKRGEVDASHAPQAIDLLLAVWTNDATSQNSFDIKGSIFDDTVTLEFGQVIDSRFGQSEGWYGPTFFGAGSEGQYLGTFTAVFANLGAGSDQFDSEIGMGLPSIGGPFLETRDTVWGGTDDDLIVTGEGNDRLFGDNGSGAWLNRDPFLEGTIAGNDHLTAGRGADWIEGNGDTGIVRLAQPELIVNGSFEEFDRTPDAETISHDGGKWFTFRELRIDNVPGWSRDPDFGEEGTSFGGPIELQTNAVGGLPAFDGQIKLELDSHPDFGQNSLTFLQQQISPTPGAHYHVSFAYAPRPGAPAGSSAFDFSFFTGIDPDPANIAASFANDQPGWHLFEADIIGSNTEVAILTFSPGFPTDTLGALIDDVRVTQELTVDLSLAGDVIDCGTGNLNRPDFETPPDSERDIVNFNAGDGFDVVHNFGAGVFVARNGRILENVDDVLRIENVGVLTTEVVFSDQGHGTLVRNGAGSVFLVGVTTPLAQSVDGSHLLLFDAP